MCDPVLIGAGVAVSQGASAIGKFQQANAQKDATNRMRANQYNAQMAEREFDWISRLNVYGQQLSEYDAKLAEGNRAYASGLYDIGANLSETYGAAAFAGQGRAQQIAQAPGQILARGQTGTSNERLARLSTTPLYQQETLALDNLLRARYGAERQQDKLRDQLISYQRQARSKVAIAPTLGPAVPKPIGAVGPSALGLAGDLFSAGFSGLSAGIESKSLWE